MSKPTREQVERLAHKIRATIADRRLVRISEIDKNSCMDVAEIVLSLLLPLVEALDIPKAILTDLKFKDSGYALSKINAAIAALRKEGVIP